MTVLNLSGVENIRDLGGAVTGDGRRIKPGLLIRSAALDKMTPEDGEQLRRCGLKTIIDLRTYTEVEEKPDKSLEGVKHLHIPILAEETIGISRGKKTQQSLMDNDLPDMEGIYRNMVTETSAVAQFKKAVETVMDHEQGAILWHCTAGKDRCGMTAALVLRLLGLDMESIMEDYMQTNEVALPLAEKIADHVLERTGNAKRAEGVRRAFIADESYMLAALDEMERLYGGLDGYIEKALGIGRERIEAFREKCLC